MSADSSDAERAADLLRRIKAGTFRFAPEVHPQTGAAFPPGWKPAPWQAPYRITDEQLAKMAEGRRVANENQRKAGPLSRRNKFGEE